MVEIDTTSFQIDEEKNGNSETLFGGRGSKITEDGDCSHEIKRCLLPEKKSYDKPRQCMKKQRHCFADKCLYSQSYGFSIVMYGCQNWIIKKAESQRIDAFELWCWRRLLRVPWTARRSNQSIPKEINREYSGLISFRIDWLNFLAV